MDARQTIFVIDVDGEQALAASMDQVRELLREKYEAAVNAMLLKKPGELGQRSLYIRAEVTEHDTGKTGWTKRR